MTVEKFVSTLNSISLFFIMITIFIFVFKNMEQDYYIHELQDRVEILEEQLFNTDSCVNYCEDLFNE